MNPQTLDRVNSVQSISLVRMRSSVHLSQSLTLFPHHLDRVLGSHGPCTPTTTSFEGYTTHLHSLRRSGEEGMIVGGVWRVCAADAVDPECDAQGEYYVWSGGGQR